MTNSFNSSSSIPDATPLELVARAQRCLIRLRTELLAERNEQGHWTGELSASALSTATAVSALSVYSRQGLAETNELRELISQGYKYLRQQQNADGGYGDTDRSHSNIATAYLALAARSLAVEVLERQLDREEQEELERLRQYISAQGELTGLRRRYGKDKTFVVPIMVNLAIAGLVSWQAIPRLPFEAAVFPGSMYRFLRMPVVSYAIPALVAIGQAQHFLGRRTVAPVRWLRSAAVNRTSQVLQNMQPESGGYLEATPLTSFVLMSLAASFPVRAGAPDRETVRLVMRQCVQFLCASIRSEGSWPIDTNLATWVTSLSVHALSRWSQDDRSWASPNLITWHLGCQHRRRHPFTGAEPGGWGWTDLSGAVPDGDDTPAALLALNAYRNVASAVQASEISQAEQAGFDWLVQLQNRDGGMPTFCRGWGRLPFDRSSTDLTAHFLRAITRCDRTQLVAAAPASTWDAVKLHRCRQQAIRFLKRTQRADGAWLPLWFGNQDNHDDENPVYGTARVLLAIADLPEMRAEAERAAKWLLANQNRDGGWGGGPSLASDASAEPKSSLEESAVALEALADFCKSHETTAQASLAGRELGYREAIIAATSFVVQAIEGDRHRDAWPIGFYFAKLWYYEKLYPLVFATAALGAAMDAISGPPHQVETSN